MTISNGPLSNSAQSNVGYVNTTSGILSAGTLTISPATYVGQNLQINGGNYASASNQLGVNSYTNTISVCFNTQDIADELFIAVSEAYPPSCLHELVRSTPKDIIYRAARDLSNSKLRTVNDKVIDSLPTELAWAANMPLDTSILYTFVKEVIHRELERFAQRIDQCFVLTPKSFEMLDAAE